MVQSLQDSDEGPSISLRTREEADPSGSAKALRRQGREVGRSQSGTGFGRAITADLGCYGVARDYDAVDLAYDLVWADPDRSTADWNASVRVVTERRCSERRVRMSTVTWTKNSKTS